MRLCTVGLPTHPGAIRTPGSTFLGGRKHLLSSRRCILFPSSSCGIGSSVCRVGTPRAKLCTLHIVPNIGIHSGISGFLCSAYFGILAQSLPSGLDRMTVLSTVDNGPLRNIILSFFSQRGGRLLATAAGARKGMRFTSSRGCECLATTGKGSATVPRVCL